MNKNFFGSTFLIALPGLEEGYFKNTITLLIEHSASGAFGMIINKPAETNLSDFTATNFELPILELPILLGGPVEQDHLYFLHSTEKSYPQTLSINRQISLTTSKTILEDLSKECAPEHVLPLLGYAGWGAGQLEFEISQGAWLISPFDKKIMFSTPCSEKREAAAKQIGVDLNLIVIDPRKH